MPLIIQLSKVTSSKNQRMVDIYKYVAFINQQKPNILIVPSTITKISLTYLSIYYKHPRSTSSKSPTNKTQEERATFKFKIS